MFVNYFTVKILASTNFETILTNMSNEFGKNIPRHIFYDGGKLGIITCLFCVDANVNIIQICKKYECEIGEPFKMEIKDDTYNSNYTICSNYIRGPKFYLTKL